MDNKKMISKFIKRIVVGDRLIEKELVSDLAIVYVITEKIEEGGMGVVYKAHDPNEKLVAIKVASTEQTIQRFRLETAVMKLLGKHPNITELYDWGLESGEIKFCVLEYLEGQTLDKIIRSRDSWFYENHLTNAIEIMEQLLQALNHVHNKKLVHRDIKPSNVMVSRTEQGKIGVKLMDFGIAKSIEKSFLSFLHKKIQFDEKTLTLPGQPMGTLGYAPQEQLDNSKVAESADIFSCGITLFEMLVGESPIASQTLSDYARKLQDFIFDPLENPEEDEYIMGKLNDILAKSLNHTPKIRYRNARKMLKEIQELKRDIVIEKTSIL